MYKLSALYTWISRWGIDEEEVSEENYDDDGNNEVTNLYQSSYVPIVTTTKIIEAVNISRLDKRKCITYFGRNTKVRKEEVKNPYKISFGIPQHERNILGRTENINRLFSFILAYESNNGR